MDKKTLQNVDETNRIKNRTNTGGIYRIFELRKKDFCNSTKTED